MTIFDSHLWHAILQLPIAGASPKTRHTTALGMRRTTGFTAAERHHIGTHLNDLVSEVFADAEKAADSLRAVVEHSMALEVQS